VTTPNIVSGAVSTVAELDKDTTWLQGWLKDRPARLGLGELDVADADPVRDDDGNPAFLASDPQDRYFSVDVRLGELDASHGFALLDNWARNRVRHPDKTHVAVLVTESTGDRYRTALETLAEHLPLIVVELQVWRGETEAIVVPHVALASKDVDLSDTPAARSAEAIARVEATKAKVVESGKPDASDKSDASDKPDAADAPAKATAESEAAGDDESPVDKDDTGVSDPWGLPPSPEPSSSGAGNGSRLLNKIGH
jgi:hypothetical protein